MKLEQQEYLKELLDNEFKQYELVINNRNLIFKYNATFIKLINESYIQDSVIDNIIESIEFLLLEKLLELQLIRTEIVDSFYSKDRQTIEINIEF